LRADSLALEIAMQRTFAIAAITLAAAFVTPAHAAFRAEFATVQGSDAYAVSDITVSGSHMRMDAGKVSTLVDAGTGSIIMLMHDKKQYMDMAKMAQAMNAMLANVPPQMREMMKQRMAAHGHGGSLVTYTNTGKSESVAGYNCTVYRVTAAESHDSDACLADISAAGIDAADQATVRKVFEDLRAMAKNATAGMASSSIGQMPTDKFPVRITRYEDGKVTEVTQIKSVTQAATADFSIPAGYSEVQMPAFGAH
jgi:hypothetical protein